jgi:hypothetical protein
MAGPTPAPARRRRRLNPMLAVFGALAFAYLAVASLVLSVDPYDIYPWGARPVLTTNDVSREASIQLVDVAAKTPDMGIILIGGSTAAMYRPDDLMALFPGEGRAYNLSYAGPRPADRDLILRRILEVGSARRVIVALDWMYIVRPGDMRPAFPAFLYDDDRANDLRMVDLKGIQRSIAVLRGDVVYDHAEAWARYQRNTPRTYAAYQTPATMRTLAQLVDRERGGVDRPSGKTCADFGSLNRQLVPTVKALAAKGVKVDLMTPVYAYPFYYEWRGQISPSLLDETVIYRRCVVEALDGVPNVRIFAMDLDPAIAGDMANYRDTGHLFTPRYLNGLIQAVAADTHRLTRRNIDAYDTGLRAAVKTYRVRNSRLDGKPADDR